MESVVTPEPTKRQPRRPRTQSLKARVDNNPFLYLVSVAVAVAVTVAGVQQFFAVQASKALEEKYQVEVKDLQTSLASINRGVEGSGNYLDVTTL